MTSRNFFTIKEFVELHRKLWDWLSNNPKMLKEDWPGWSQNGGYYNSGMVTNECWLCASTQDKDNNIFDCKLCPVKWPHKVCDEFDNSPYNMWLTANTTKTRVKWARVIRDLPMKERYK